MSIFRVGHFHHPARQFPRRIGIGLDMNGWCIIPITAQNGCACIYRGIFWLAVEDTCARLSVRGLARQFTAAHLSGQNCSSWPLWDIPKGGLHQMGGFEMQPTLLNA